MTRLVPFLALLFVAPLAGCGGPFVLLPGGELSGTVTAAPADWSLLAEVGTVQLETAPGDPYSVNIWAIGMGPAVYVHAGANRSTWVEHMEADPRVRMRVGDALYELAAERVTEQPEFDRFAGAYDDKYGRRPRNEDVGEAYLFRLSPR